MSLQLRKRDDAHEPAAWLITGRNPAVWLGHLCAWEIPLESLRLLPVPSSRTNPSPAGLLVLTPHGFTPPESPIVFPYALLEPSIYLPADADLWPPASPQELRSILHGDLHVFLPAIGLISCQMEQLVGVADLVTAPPVAAGTFNQAPEGAYLNQRLERVDPEITPDVEQLLQGGKDDIGQENASDLEPLKGEGAGDSLGTQAASGALRAAGWAAGKISELLGGSGKTGKENAHQGMAKDLAGWLERMQSWIQMRASQVGRSLDEVRNREVQRLLDALERDPDRGLRYALPLSSTPGRGLARPGGRLTAHSTDFSLRGMGGSFQSDPWYLREQLRQQLLAKYREAANRELGLGRYRRAAYIFGHLLGDLTAAANALRQGRYFREAAVLYRNRLKNSTMAAECLEQGGLLLEAIEVYTQLDNHEKVGDLYAKLGREQESHEAYRSAAAKCQTHGELIEAARIYDAKLGEPDEALRILGLGWPHTSHAMPCMASSFAILARLGRHDQAQAYLQHLGRALPVTTSLAVMAKTLGEIARTYPAAEVQSRAADLSRVVIAKRLPLAPATEQQTMLATLRTLAPNDELLVRDCNRFAGQLQQRKPKPLPLKPLKPAKESGIVRTIQLDERLRWVSAFSAGEWFCAVGTDDDRTVLVRSDFTGLRQSVEWPAPIPEEVLLLQYLPESQHILLMHSGRPLLITAKSLPATSNLRTALGAGPLPHVELQHVHALCADEQATLWMLYSLIGEHDPALAAVNTQTGAIVSSYSLATPAGQEHNHSQPWHLSARGIWRVVAQDRQLIAYHNRALSWSVTLNSTIRSLVPYPHLIRGATWFIACMERGACLVSPGYRAADAEAIARDLTNPVAATTQTGTLLLAGEGEAAGYSLTDPTPKRLFTLPTNARSPRAILPTVIDSEFGLLYESGIVAVMRHPNLSTESSTKI